MIGKPIALIQVPSKRGFPITEAAQYLGMHPQTLRELSDLGTVPARKVGKRRLFLLEDLDAWLERQPRWVANGNC